MVDRNGKRLTAGMIVRRFLSDGSFHSFGTYFSSHLAKQGVRYALIRCTNWATISKPSHMIEIASQEDAMLFVLHHGNMTKRPRNV